MRKLLSNRELEIVERLVYMGTKKEAAPSLGITERTLETHTKNIFRKLTITKLNELVLWYCGETFHITEQIESRKKEVMSITRKSTTILIILIFTIITAVDHSEFLRYRRYRRRTESEYLICYESITTK
ncbi:MAG: LuxR C-terminal-related transcriptional regulator [Prevotella sp.]|jgi:DNA-binding CsgD family transcriptional regulator|nr:LuxR C-terminal-related transcriptional regulator [Prevotella sp.]